MSNPQERKRVPRSILYALIASYIAALLTTGANLWYTNHVNTESNHKWCQLITLLNNAYEQSPPVNEIGKKIAAAMIKLRTDFDC